MLCAKLTTLSSKKKRKKIVSWLALKLSLEKMKCEEPEIRGSEVDNKTVNTTFCTYNSFK